MVDDAGLEVEAGLLDELGLLETGSEEMMSGAEHTADCVTVTVRGASVAVAVMVICAVSVAVSRTVLVTTEICSMTEVLETTCNQSVS